MNGRVSPNTSCNGRKNREPAPTKTIRKENMAPRYCPEVNKEYWDDLPIDMFARRSHFLEHLAPIWFKIPEERRGRFYVPAYLLEFAHVMGIQAEPLRPLGGRKSDMVVYPAGNGPIVTAAYGDMQLAWEKNIHRPLILMEHGVGLTPTGRHAGYAGGEGLRSRVSLFLAPNEYIRKKTAKVFPTAPQAVIGTPKLDKWADARKKEKDKPATVAVAFHWDGSAVSPEAGNAWAWYKEVIPQLSTRYHVIGHGHPKMMDKLAKWYEGIGIEAVQSFEEVMERADVYVNDCSSTMYEFCVTGRPVVVLNAPWFRRDVHFGIRFWDYSDVGVAVEQPGELGGAVASALRDGKEWQKRRSQYVCELYPHLGCAAQTAATAILDFLKEKHENR
jgi:hypothetical protein